MFRGLGARNGERMPIESLCVPVEDRGFLLGDAVYETFRTYEGRLFALADHLDRLEASLSAVRIRDAPDRQTLSRWLEGTTEEAWRILRKDEGRVADELVVRVTVTRGPGPHGFSPRGAGPAQVYILARPLPPAADRVYSEGLSTVTAKVRRVPVEAQDPAIKAGSALNLVLARLEADDKGADEALLTDARGDYLEASGANLFALKDGVFWSPRAGDGILEGVTMRRLVAILEADGWSGERKAIPPEVLFSADEVLLTQTTREVIPVSQIDGRAIGTGRPGPESARLRARFREEVRRWRAT